MTDTTAIENKVVTLKLKHIGDRYFGWEEFVQEVEVDETIQILGNEYFIVTATICDIFDMFQSYFEFVGNELCEMHPFGAHIWGALAQVLTTEELMQLDEYIKTNYMQ